MIIFQYPGFNLTEIGAVASLMMKMMYLGVVVEVAENLTIVGLGVLDAPAMIG